MESKDLGWIVPCGLRYDILKVLKKYMKKFANWIGIGVLVLLVVAGYVLSRPPGGTSPLPQDPKAVEALQLIKTHVGRNGKTLEQWVNEYIRGLEKAGTPVRVGGWQVGSEGNDSYHVRMLIREKGVREWIQREFAWRVNLQDKSIRVISLAAVQFMPLHELPPLPHQDQISFRGIQTPPEGRLG